MLTFLRCGVYRLVHGRKFWIGTALASVLCFAVMALMFVTMGMVDVDGTVSTGTVHLTVGGERYAGVEMDADDAALLGMFADRTVPNHSFLLVFMGFFQGGMAGLLVSIIATLAYAEDHKHGFVKAELAGRAGRIGYYASHLVLAALLAAWYSLVVIASTELAFAVFGIRVADSEPFGQYWRLAGLEHPRRRRRDVHRDGAAHHRPQQGGRRHHRRVRRQRGGQFPGRIDGHAAVRHHGWHDAVHHPRYGTCGSWRHRSRRKHDLAAVHPHHLAILRRLL